MNRSSFFRSESTVSASLRVAVVVAAGALSAPLFAQDECTSAVALTTGAPAAFSTLTATPSAGIPVDTSCASSNLLWTANTPDVWFKWTATADGVANFDACTENTSAIDTSLVLYTGSCGSLVQIACNGDALHNLSLGCNPTDSKIANVKVTAGTQYYLRVGGIDSSFGVARGAGQITVTLARVAAWGDNSVGQCLVPATLGNPKKIAGGYTHILAIKEDNTVVGWGSNLLGQITIPASVTTVRDVAAGQVFSVAARSDGTLVGWGSNSSGRATPPTTITDAVSVAAGGFHGLARRATGTVVAWGAGGAGANNNGTANNFGQSIVPSGLSLVTQVSAGYYHSVAVRSDGRVSAWGAGTTGGPAGSNYGQSNVPGGLADATKVSCGWYHNVALRADGTVVCWGAGATNNSANPHWGQSIVPTTLAGVIDVAGGQYFSVALLANGTVVGWGHNVDYQLNPPTWSGPLGAITTVGTTSFGIYDGCPEDPTSTLDCVDNCPNDPNKREPGVCGCGVPDIDTDGDGFMDCQDGCPTNPALSTPNTFYADADADGFGNAAAPVQSCTATAPAGAVANSSDCNDALVTYADIDGDGYGAGLATACGTSSNATDCNDSVSAINPGASEICDAGNVDENCNNLADNADATALDAGKSNFYRDQDNDTYTLAAATRFCDIVTGYLAAASASVDCNDANAAINPGASEVCDALNTDENCNSLADNADATTLDAGKTNFFADADNDTYTLAAASRFCDQPAGFLTVASASADCNDNAADVHPGAVENCANRGVDNNCNGIANSDAEAIDASDYFADNDGDTYGAGSVVKSCVPQTGLALTATDCDDANAAVHPGASEVCDAANTDENCNGLADNADASALDAGKTDFFADADNDTYTLAAASRFCDQPTGYRTAASAAADCNDTNAAVNPGASEICDALNTDENCNSLADNADATALDAGKTNFFADADNDTYTLAAASRFCDQPTGYRTAASASVDCNDANAAVNPGASEICDALDTDENCNNLADNADATALDTGKTNFFADADNDTYTVAASSRFCDQPAGYRTAASASADCNDTNAAVNPGASEVCDALNTDENCNGLADNADAAALDAGKSNFYRDQDNDTYTLATATRFCDIVTGYRAAASASVDCNDTNAAINPGATEVCDALNTDENCNGLADNADATALASTKSDFFADADSDTYTVAAASRFCDQPAGYRAAASASVDCNDSAADVYPGAVENCANRGVDNNCNGIANSDAEAIDASDYFADNDGDTYGAGAVVKSCVPQTGLVLTATDCNDANAAINPGASEVCDALNTDENCNGLADNADATALDAGKSNFYRDQDGDAYTVAAATRFCDIVTGYLAAASASVDCNDANAAINPGASEVCDALNTDENCNSLADNADATALDAGKTNFFADADNDTYTLAAASRFCDQPAGFLTVASATADCNDNAAEVHPGAVENCANRGVDNNCNGIANSDAEAIDASDYFADNDGDTYGAGAAVKSCVPQAGRVLNSTDCNDANAAVNPGASEVCDAANTDENCNGLADNADSAALDAGKTNFYRDQDGDSYTVATATRFCDIVTGYLAAASASADCNDNAAAINPGASEVCDALNTDENCNNLADNADASALDAGKTNFFADADNDTYTLATASRFCDLPAGYLAAASASADCNDTNAAINPAASEVCDAANTDENCNGLADNADSGALDAGRTNFWADVDNDTYTLATVSRFCDLPTGYRTAASAAADCNDNAAGINPGASEICDAANTDENCNGLADNADSGALDAGKTNFYRDQDNDTYTVAAATRFCDQTAGYRVAVSSPVDCNDANAAVNPGASEICDATNTDENCNGSADDADATVLASTKSDFFADLDADNFTIAAAARFCDQPVRYRGAPTAQADCNDANAAINPGALEICDPLNTDENCNSLADDTDPGTLATSKFNFWADLDDDTYTISTISRFCDQPVRYRAASSAEADCNDSSAAINPGATEVCDAGNVDENCNTLADDADATVLASTKSNFWADADNDTYTVASASRFCDLPAGFRTAASSAADCNDARADINPGVSEICDATNTDENCNGSADDADATVLASTKTDFWADADNDAYTVATLSRFCDQSTGFRTAVSALIDCNDANGAINPGATEICDASNVDENCNSLADNADAGAADAGKTNFWADADNDAYTLAAASRFCDLPSGFRVAASALADCNDANGAINPGASEICDALNTDENCNNLADNADSGALDAGKTGFWADLDNDTYTLASAGRFCDLPANFRTAASTLVDCNDANAAVHPGATEVCDAADIDENCNTLADNADSGALESTKTDFWADADGDTYTVTAASRFCDMPALYRVAVSAAIDCNDAVAAINPGMTEVCDAGNVDENCNNIADNADAGAADAGKTNFWADADGDSYTVAAVSRFCDQPALYLTAVSAAIDCNDAVAAINPGMTEVCDAGNVDEDCNNHADDLDAGVLESTKTNFWADADGDSYTVAAVSRFCDQPALYLTAVSAAIDCNDAVAAINPGMTELCDAANTDEDCNTLADNADIGALESTKTNFWADADSDTYTVAAVSRFCDQPALYLAAVSAAIDCNDARADINPGKTELCDAADIDEDCNTLADNADIGALESTKTSFWADADSDAYTVAEATRFCDIVTGYLVSASTAIDCNDAVAAINPGMTELCDAANIDEDCNTLADDADAGALESTKTNFWADLDSDTYTVAAATRVCDQPALYLAAVSAAIDCNDAVAAINPGMTELCDAANTDEDCNTLADDADAGALESTKTDFWADADSDTYTVATVSRFCDQPALYLTAVSAAIDCNDVRADINPGKTELCDAANIDEDCNTLADDADAGALESTKTNFWADADSDTYTVAIVSRFCDQPALYLAAVSTAIDCNDAVAAINPGMTELCDAANTDEDCNTLADDADAGALESTKTNFWADLDSDTYTVAAATRVCDQPALYLAAVSAAIDCNDAVAAINPGMTELCDAANTDEDCNTLADDADSGALESTKTDFWADADSDTYTVAAVSRFCDQPALYLTVVSAAIDCNDARADINPGKTELCDAANIDEDCNTLADDADAGALESTKTNFWADADSDTYTVAIVSRFCDQPALYLAAVSTAIDCNDAVAAINPGMTELCDAANTDEDCNTLADDADAGALESTKTNFWADLDSDTYTVAAATRVCDQPALYLAAVSAAIDCNDAVAAINPGMTELCDAANTDEDCNTLADDADAGALESTKTDFWADADSDTYTVATVSRFCDQPALYLTVVSAAIDCNDARADINPGKTELCDAANIDEDCNTLADDADAGALESTKTNFWADADSDTYTVAIVSRFCDQPALYLAAVSTAIDCNDAVAAINPGMTELCDAANIDEDCNDRADDLDTAALESTKTDFWADLDNDAYTVATVSRFCDQPALYRAAATTAIDCNDARADINPGMTELCDAADTDEDCNTLADNADIGALESTKTGFFADLDNDGFTIEASAAFCDKPTLYHDAASHQIDCHDADAAINPAATELCDANDIDENCNNRADNADLFALESTKTDFFADLDADGFTVATATRFCDIVAGYVATATDGVDCDDAAPLTHPGAVELCATTSVDNNCDGVVNDVDALAADKVEYFRDGDLDGFTIAETARFCPGTDTTGYLPAPSDRADCDDSSNQVFPGAVENCANLAVDNDCNGSTAESEAIDRLTFFGDADADLAGDPATTTLACSVPAGFVDNANDACPANGALTAKVTYYADADADGEGDPANSIQTCDSSAPAGYSATSADGCPSDPAKTAPGTCGCGVADVDSDGDLRLDCVDNCPSVANADQANCDTDSLGNACDADDDNDGVTDINDAYACEAGRSDLDAGYSAAEITAFLSGATGATVDGTGMTLEQLRAVAAMADHIATAGLGGVFTLDKRFTPAEIATLLGKAAPATGFLGGAVVTIDAVDMTHAQLDEVVGRIGAVTTIVRLTLDASFDAASITALVSRSAEGEATVIATGMTQAQLLAGVSGPTSVHMRGELHLDASYTAEQIARIMGSTVAGLTTVTVDSSGMSAAQQGALQAGASIVIDADAAVAAGGTFTVYVDVASLPLHAVGIQASVSFDPTMLEFVASEPIGGIDFPWTLFTQQTADSVRFSTGIDLGGDRTGITSGNVARLTFRALHPLCGATSLVWLTPSGFDTCITSAASANGNSVAIPYSVVNRASIASLNSVGFAGLPSSISLPADAGNSFGAFVAAPTVTASNNCETVPVATLVQYPASSGLPAGSAWPGEFPVGVTTITWSAIDPLGVVRSESRTVEVLDHQIAVLDIQLQGIIHNPSFVLPVRVQLDGGAAILAEVAFHGSAGEVREIQVPVGRGYSCMTVKDAEHTLASALPVRIEGTKYVTTGSFSLIGGDSNDDNLVDIIDFGLLVVDRGAGKSATSRSNFNRDGFVTNHDLTYIAINFLRHGESCVSGFDGREPLARVSVKDLRRMGLGHLAAADANGDGWVDATDIGLVGQGILPRGSTPSAESGHDGSATRW